MKICFINWWSNGVNDFFYFFVKKYINAAAKIDKKNPDIAFCSVFGDRNKIINFVNNNKKCVHIFFTGESTIHQSHKQYDDYLLDIVDISLGFKYINHDKYNRFPLWLTYINMDSNMGKPELEFSKLFSFVNNENRNKFCCILNNHDNFNTRTNIFNKLNSYKKVDSGGNWNKNIDYKIKQGEKYKNKWLSNYKFNICCEAIIENGYITEKIFECLLAGCIPIYFVNNENNLIEENVINQDIIIKFNNNNIDNVIEYIKLLDINTFEYHKFINQPIITDNAINEIYKKYNQLSLLTIKSLEKKKCKN